MIFEDVEHKYKLYGVQLPPQDAQIALVKKVPAEVLNKIEGAPREVLIGYFRDETIARNVALAMEFYKLHNKS